MTALFHCFSSRFFSGYLLTSYLPCPSCSLLIFLIANCVVLCFVFLVLFHVLSLLGHRLHLVAAILISYYFSFLLLVWLVSIIVLIRYHVSLWLVLLSCNLYFKYTHNFSLHIFALCYQVLAIALVLYPLFFLQLIFTLGFVSYAYSVQLSYFFIFVVYPLCSYLIIL